MKSLQTFASLYRLLGPARALFWLTVVAAVISALWSAITFFSASAVVQQLASGAGMRWAGFSRESVFGQAAGLLDRIDPGQRVLVGFVVMAVSMLIGSAIALGTVALSMSFLSRFLVHLQTTCFNVLLDARLAFHDETRRSELNQLVIVEVRSCYNLMKAITTVAANGLQLFVQIAAMALISVPLTVVFVVVGVVAWAVGTRLNRLAKRWSQAALARRNDLMAVAHDVLYGIKPVKLLSHRALAIDRLTAASRQSTQLFVRSGLLINGQTTVMKALGLAAVTATVVLSIMAPHELSPVHLAVFLFVAVGMLAPGAGVARELGIVTESLAAVESVTAFLQKAPDVRERDGRLERARLLDARIVFDDVYLDYADRPGILQGVSLVVARGERIGIAGPSGSGKTSLVNLLPRLYDPVKGRVLVDGTDVREFRLDFLRDRIGVLSQDVFIFNATVRENILMGRPGATDEEIVEAARMAHAHDFIMAMPSGYATVTGDRGVKLSGGQRQRLAIAQVFLKNPEVLVLDEATSSLDSESEALVQQAIDRLSVNRTVITVAHRLSTLRAVDRIVVLQDGRVIEMGNWDELRARGGVFARLWDAQSAAAPVRTG